MPNLTPKGFADEYLPKQNDSEVNLVGLSALFAKDAIDPDQLKKLYANTEALFMCDDDRLAGITTRKLTTPEEFAAVWLEIEDYPTGVAYYRDATDKTLLARRANPDDPRYARNQLMLRSLNIVRGIDHAFEQLATKTEATGGKDFYNGLRRLLAGFYRKLLETYDLKRRNYSLAEIEQKFNSELVQLLHAGSLDLGIKDNFKESYQQLLLNYRLLAGTIEPAAAMVAKFKDHVNGTGAEFVEIAWPITKKTEAQEEELKKIGTVSEVRNYHTVQSPAVQLAQTLFADRLLADDSIMSDQLNKAIAPGVKNGYITELAVNFTGSEPTKYSFARSGSLVYMGKGEEASSLDKHTRENVIQIRQAGGVQDDIQLHSTVLNTNTLRKDEGKIVSGAQRVLASSGGLFSNIPVNWQGQFDAAILAAPMQTSQDLPQSTGFGHGPKTGRFNRERRAFFAGKVVFVASQLKKVFSIFSCASGRDRTGIQDELVKSLCIKHACEQGQCILSFRDALALKMQSLSSPFLGTLASPGSRGIKSESKPGKLLGAHSAQLFLSTANTNKRTPVDEGRVEEIAIQHSRFFSLSPDGNGGFSFNMRAPDVVLKALGAYVEDATGFGGGFMKNRELLNYKVKETNGVISTIRQDLQTLTLSTLKEKLQTLQSEIKEKTKQTNDASFFKHGSGRLDETIEACLQYINDSQKRQEEVCPPSTPRPSLGVSG